MSVDLFTFAAQIVNFAILLLLLRRFLFKPIVSAMDKREKLIADRLSRAESLEKIAAEKEARIETLIKEFNADKQNLFARAAEEAANSRHKLEASARDEVDTLRKDWIEGFELERGAIAADLRQRSGRIMLSIMRRMFRDLADDELEQGIVRTFIKRLSQLPPAVRPGTGRTGKSDWLVVSSFAIPDPGKEEIRKLIGERIDPDRRVGFSVEKETLFGIELRFDERRLAWHLDDYLGQLNEAMQELESKSIRTQGPVKP